MKRALVWATILLTIGWGRLAGAHETDQFTVPPDREFADLGPFFNRWAYQAIEHGVELTNAQIRAAIEAHKSAGVLAELQSAPHVTMAVRNQWPWSVTQIEKFEQVLASPAMRDRYPGRIVAYGEPYAGVYQFAFFPLDVRQFAHLLFFSSTIKVYGTYLGTDKLGHFTDEGISYYFAYRSARDAGASEKEAIAKAVRLGTDGLMSEMGLLGMAANADYSNGDLSGNFAGFLFYRNLTETLPIKGRLQSPMLMRDGLYWRLASDVRPDSDFFARFISDHLDEALNPGFFDPFLRSGMRAAVRARTRQLLHHYRDEHGQPRPREWFDRKLEELRTYWGVDYGHMGTYDELVSIGSSCFDSVPPPPARRDDDNVKLAASVLRPERLWVQSDVPAPRHHTRALAIAVREHKTVVVRDLLSDGADPNDTSAGGVTPLHLACSSPALESILIDAGARVNVADAWGQTPLHWAASEPDSEASVSLLLDDGARANAPDHDGRTPLHLAALAGNASGVRDLLRRGASVAAADRFGQTTLHLAAENRNGAVVRQLLSAGAQVNARDAFGRTPLDEAARSGSVEAARRLLHAGADPNAADDYGSTPLHLACRNGRLEVVKLLLDRGADPNAASEAGATPLHESALSGDALIVRLLLDHGADRSARDRHNRTAMDIGISHGFADVIQVLRSGVSPGSGGGR